MTSAKPKIAIEQKEPKQVAEPITSKKWNILAITYNVSNKPPSQQIINQILETTMKNTDLSFVMISLQVGCFSEFLQGWDYVLEFTKRSFLAFLSCSNAFSRRSAPPNVLECTGVILGENSFILLYGNLDFCVSQTVT